MPPVNEISQRCCRDVTDPMHSRRTGMSIAVKAPGGVLASAVAPHGACGLEPMGDRVRVVCGFTLPLLLAAGRVVHAQSPESATSATSAATASAAPASSSGPAA